jgi:hypothetical protein
MQLGEIVEYQGRLWQVSIPKTALQVHVLQSLSGEKLEVANDDPEVVVLAHPAEEWPFVVASLRRADGPLRHVRRNGQELTPLVQWTTLDILTPSSSVFFHPALQLKLGEVLVGVHRNGRSARISVTSKFGTERRRRLRAAKPRAPEVETAWERLLSRDMFGDE